MRSVAIGITLLALAVPPAASATSLICPGLGRNVHWSERHDPSRARLAITTEDGDMTLLLTDREVAFQLSERTMRLAQRKLREAREDQDNWFAFAIVSAVTGTVGELLDHSLVCRVRDLRDVSYERGRLVLTGRHGRVVFDREDDSDPDGMSGFSEPDARRFVQEFRRVKAAQ